MPFGERLNIQNDRVARDFYRVVADEQRFAELWHNPQFQQIVKRLDFIYRQGLNKMKKWYVTILLLGLVYFQDAITVIHIKGQVWCINLLLDLWMGCCIIWVYI